MPWMQPSIPWQGSTSLSAHASREGARQADKRAASQTVRLLELYAQYGPLTDAEAARHLGVERTSVNARRVPLVTRGFRWRYWFCLPCWAERQRQKAAGAA